MASFRKYKGGAEKEQSNKERKKKECRQQEIISKTTKLSTCFGSTNNTNISETEAMQSEDTARAHHAETDPTVPLLADSISITSLSLVSENNSDIGTWGNLSEEKRESWIQRGYEECQHWEDDMSASVREFSTNTFRYYSKSFLFRVNDFNKDKSLRIWLFYSPSKGSLFCTPCMLFAEGSSTIAQQPDYQSYKFHMNYNCGSGPNFIDCLNLPPVQMTLNPGLLIGSIITQKRSRKI